MHRMFGLKHLLLAGISALMIGGLYLLLRRKPLERLYKPMLLAGLCSEIIKVFYYILANEAEYGGILPKTDLPFHLCSIQILFFALLVFSDSPKLKDTLLNFMLPSCLFGGIAAILIPTASSLNGMPILSAQYFGYHCALTVFALVLLTSKERLLTVKHYFTCLKFLLGLMLAAIYINSILYDGNSNINFMYVVSPPQAGLPFLNENHGWLVYMCHYAGLILFCVTLCYIKPIITALKRKLCRKNAVPA